MTNDEFVALPEDEKLDYSLKTTLEHTHLSSSEIGLYISHISRRHKVPIEVILPLYREVGFDV